MLAFSSYNLLHISLLDVTHCELSYGDFLLPCCV